MLLLTVLWYQLSIGVKNNPDQNKQADEDVLPITEIQKHSHINFKKFQKEAAEGTIKKSQPAIFRRQASTVQVGVDVAMMLNA